MEHAWWLNPFCNSFAENLYNEEGRVCWVGDYAGEEGDFDFNLNFAFYTPSYKEVWGETVILHSSKSTNFTLDNKFLLNHDTKEFIDLNEYKEKSVDDDGWVIHPLPLLTAVGNADLIFFIFIKTTDCILMVSDTQKFTNIFGDPPNFFVIIFKVTKISEDVMSGDLRSQRLNFFLRHNKIASSEKFFDKLPRFGYNSK